MNPDKLRFQLELEFVQCLSNPHYLQFLSHQSYFSDPSFINYLAYLQYWHQPIYAKYLTYPVALEILTMIQDKSFREKLGNTENSLFIHAHQFANWENKQK